MKRSLDSKKRKMFIQYNSAVHTNDTIPMIKICFRYWEKKLQCKWQNSGNAYATGKEHIHAEEMCCTRHKQKEKGIVNGPKIKSHNSLHTTICVFDFVWFNASILWRDTIWQPLRSYRCIWSTCQHDCASR